MRSSPCCWRRRRKRWIWPLLLRCSSLRCDRGKRLASIEVAAAATSHHGLQRTPPHEETRSATLCEPQFKNTLLLSFGSITQNQKAFVSWGASMFHPTVKNHSRRKVFKYQNRKVEVKVSLVAPLTVSKSQRAHEAISPGICQKRLETSHKNRLLNNNKTIPNTCYNHGGCTPEICFYYSAAISAMRNTR